MTAINSILTQFYQNIFSPDKDSGNKLPNAQGNYLFCLRDGAFFPTMDTNIKPVFAHFNGFRVIYTGIASKSFRDRDYKSHFGNNAGRSTLRKSIGVLFGYKQVRRDKNPESTKTKFSELDEANLTNWMKTNLLMFYFVNPDWKTDEVKLINYFNPPLNLRDNHSSVNLEFRKLLKRIRADKLSCY